MEFAIWLAVGGGLLVLITLGGSLLERLPLSTAMLTLCVGVALSPLGAGLAAPDAIADAPVLERLTEIIVLISLFSSGLKMSAGLHNRRWFPPLRLAVLSMIATVAGITAVGVWGLGLPLGAAVLLGGILAPTDPVLATEVQVADPGDRDQLRFALTGEGGLNDGTAFPVVMLGLGLLGLHEIGDFGWRWWAVDVLWATAAGISIGAALGVAVGRLVLYLRHSHRQAVGLDHFLALGLIGLSYGAAVLLHAYGFLAVFAAGLALRYTEQAATREAVVDDAVESLPAPETAAPEQLATHPRHGPAFMAQAVMSFNEQLDRIGEIVGVITIGLLVSAVTWQPASCWFVPLVLLVIRPLAVAMGLAGSSTSRTQRRLIGWFGIRGIGSMFYLAYALNHGVPPELASTLVALTMSVVVTSIVVHGVSVTPLMARYRQRRTRSDNG